MVVRDVNGDARMDLVTANTSSSVSVLLATGSSFAEHIEYGTGISPYAFAVGDVSRDGKPDLVTANIFSNTLSVLLGNGDGTFQPKVDVGAGLYPSSVAVGDMNGDARPDLITTNFYTYTVSVLLGNDTDGFLERRGFVTGRPSNAMAIGDLDKDGRLDVVTANSPWQDRFGNLYSSVSVLRNIGYGIVPVVEASVELDPELLNLDSHARWLTAYIELLGLNPQNIDAATVRLAGTIPADPKFGSVGDHDSDGWPDLMVKFGRSAVDALLVPGVNRLTVTGKLTTGQTFSGTDNVSVIDSKSAPMSASVSPNPLNPSGTLTYQTVAAGPVRLRVFDLRGRLVRTLVDSRSMASGIHVARIDGRAERGEELGSGVYFYRLETSTGSETGRFTILK
jgi:hypothetical protein